MVTPCFLFANNLLIHIIGIINTVLSALYIYIQSWPLKLLSKFYIFTTILLFQFRFLFNYTTKQMYSKIINFQ